MTVAPLPGNVRFRAFQMGVQSAWDTPVAATRRIPWRFTPTVDPHWTSPDVDTGTLDPAIAPYQMATDVTGQAVGPLAADDAAALWAGLLKAPALSGPTDSAYTYQYSPASGTPMDDFELFTAEWGDDVVADQWQYVGGTIDQLQLQYPQDLGPIQITADFRFARATYPNTMTGGLAVDTHPQWLYAADTQLLIDDSAGSIGITPLINTMHDAQIQIQTNVDVKRFANGSNANFAVAGYGRGARTMQTTFTLGKTAQALDEVVNWLNADPVERFLALNTTSRGVIGAASHPSQRIRFAGFWFTRSEQAVNSNSAIQLVCNHVVDPDLVAPIDVRVVNRMSALLAPPA